MNDLISRQAAIDTINEIRGTMNMVADIVADKYLIITQDNIRLLPPVQPEIIRCKDCRWYLEDEYGGWCDEVNERPTEGNDYCSYAERKTDGSD